MFEHIEWFVGTMLVAAGPFHTEYVRELTGSRVVVGGRDERGVETRLMVALRAAHDDGSWESEVELMDSAHEFASGYRRRRIMPEGLVIALKKAFARIDGRIPSLVQHVIDSRSARDDRTCGPLYPRVFAACLDAYFADAH